MIFFGFKKKLKLPKNYKNPPWGGVGLGPLAPDTLRQCCSLMCLYCINVKDTSKTHTIESIRVDINIFISYILHTSGSNAVSWA